MNLSKKEKDITSLIVLWAIVLLCLSLELFCYSTFLNSSELGAMSGYHVGKAMGIAWFFSFLFLLLKTKLKTTVWRVCLIFFTSSICSSCVLQLWTFYKKDLPSVIAMQRQEMILTAADIAKKEDEYFIHIAKHLVKLQNVVVPLSKMSDTSKYSNIIYLINTKEDIRGFIDNIKKGRARLNEVFVNCNKLFQLKGVFDRKFRASFVNGFLSGRKEVEKKYDQFFLLVSKIYENYYDYFNFLIDNRSKFQFINSKIICEVDGVLQEFNQRAENINLAQTNYVNYLDEFVEE